MKNTLFGMLPLEMALYMLQAMAYFWLMVFAVVVGIALIVAVVAAITSVIVDEWANRKRK